MADTVLASVATVFDPKAVLLSCMDRLSVEGVALRLDDVPVHDAADVFINGCTTIDEYCWARYSPNALKNSPWVYQRLVDICTYLLDERRNNAPGPGVTGAFKRTIKALEKIEVGRKTIPNTPVRKSEAPVLSATHVRLDPYVRQTIERAISTGRPEGYTPQYDTNEDASAYYI